MFELLLRERIFLLGNEVPEVHIHENIPETLRVGDKQEYIIPRNASHLVKRLLTVRTEEMFDYSFIKNEIKRVIWNIYV